MPGVVDDSKRYSEPEPKAKKTIKNSEKAPVEKYEPPVKRRPLTPKPSESAQPDMIFLQ